MTSEFPNANDFTDPIEYAQTFIIEDDDMSSLSMSDLPRFWQEDLTSPEGNFLTVSAGNQMFEKCWWSSRNAFDEDDADEYVWIEKGLTQVATSKAAHTTRRAVGAAKTASLCSALRSKPVKVSG